MVCANAGSFGNPARFHERDGNVTGKVLFLERYQIQGGQNGGSRGLEKLPDFFRSGEDSNTRSRRSERHK